MSEISFSDGFNGALFHANQHEHLWFPKADLVKVNKLSPQNQSDPLEEFYRNKIAKLLYPSLFPDLIAVRFSPTELYPSIFHSAKIAGLEEHAVYTSHTIDLNPNVKDVHRHVMKSSECECSDCANHRLLHADPKFRKIVELTGGMLYFSGIEVDYRDQTDFCKTSEGGVVFFETDDLMKPDLVTFLKKKHQHLLKADFSDVPGMDEFLRMNYKLADFPSIVYGLAERYFRKFSEY